MRTPYDRRSERGVTAVVVAIVLTVLAGFLALSLNTGHLMMVRGQLQNATDAAALAAAQELNGTAPGLAAARTMAWDYAQRHDTDAAADVVIDPATDVVFGNWDQALARTLPFGERKAAFREITSTTPNDLKFTNAVLVKAGREQARANPVEVFMGGLLGKNQSDVLAESIAVLGGPCEEGCAVPLAFAECIVVNPDGSLNCGTQLVFNSDNTDNIGFTNLANDPTVSVSVLRDILRGNCKHVGVGDPIGVGNGASLNPLVMDFQPYVGKQVSAPVVRLPGGCPAKFNEHGSNAPVVGFATFTIDAVVGAPTKTIYISLECSKIEPEPVSPGCEFFGTAPMKPRLVR